MQRSHRRELMHCLLLYAAWAVAMWALPAAPVQAQQAVRIPPASALYRHRVEQAVARAWGVQGSAALLAAKLHQESGWRHAVSSPAGAQGIAQFMPATARWMGEVFPDLAGFDPFEPQQAIMAAALYDKHLFDLVIRFGPTPMTRCSRLVFMQRAYNGGMGWLNRERRLAKASGADPNDWRAVEPFRVRAGWAHRENTQYPRRILLTLEPAYLAAGWPGRPSCP